MQLKQDSPKPDQTLIKHVLHVHDEYKQHTPHPEVLGDGFLYAKNCYFRNIRNCVLALGASITTEDHCHYRVFQSGSLDAILKTKKLVSTENVACLREIEARRPGRFLFSEVQIASNYLHHESSHILADYVFTKDSFSKVPIKDLEQKEALRFEFAESISSTHDLLAAIEISDPTEKILYKFSTGWEARHCEEYKQLRQDLGFSGIYKLTFMGFLFANMLYSSISDADIKRTLALLFPKRKWTTTEKRLVRKIMTCSSPLYISNEVTVSNFYFRLMFNSNRDVLAMLDFDFQKVLEKYPEILSGLEQLSAMTEYGLESASFLNR